MNEAFAELTGDRIAEPGDWFLANTNSGRKKLFCVLQLMGKKEILWGTATFPYEKCVAPLDRGSSQPKRFKLLSKFPYRKPEKYKYLK